MLRRRSWSATIRRLLCDVVTSGGVAVTSRAQLVAENLFLRRQLALHQQRRVKPRRADGIPDPVPDLCELLSNGHGLPRHVRVVATPILGGLHHEYRLRRNAA